MKKIISLGFLLSVPSFVGAAAYAPTTIDLILQKLVGFLNYIVPALITIAVVYFIWGVISFMTSSDEEAKKMGRTKIINGLIGLFVIVSFWGIIAVVKNTFGVGNITGESIVPLTGTNQAR